MTQATNNNVNAAVEEMATRQTELLEATLTELNKSIRFNEQKAKLTQALAEALGEALTRKLAVKPRKPGYIKKAERKNWEVLLEKSSAAELYLPTAKTVINSLYAKMAKQKSHKGSFYRNSIEDTIIRLCLGYENIREGQTFVPTKEEQDDIQIMFWALQRARVLKPLAYTAIPEGMKYPRKYTIEENGKALSSYYVCRTKVKNVKGYLYKLNF